MEVLFAGCAAHSMAGRKGEVAKFDGVTERNILTFSRMVFPKGVSISLVIAGNTASHYFFLGEGKAFAWGRNEDGQLGTGNDKNVYSPSLVDLPSTASRVVGGACGFHSSYLFGEAGDLYASGSNDCGQLGIGSNVESSLVFTLVEFKTSTASVMGVAAGKDFACCVTTEGFAYSWGSPQFGQLGNGTEGKSLEKAGRESFAYRLSPGKIKDLESICQVSAGQNHALAMDVEGRVFAWGFGGYGRLGLGHCKDQLEPAAIPLFSVEPPPPNPNIPVFAQRVQPKTRAKSIACGVSCSYALLREPFDGMLYFWGITKKAGESTIKPTLYDELQHLKLVDVSVGVSSTICISQDEEEPMVITWGCSPTYGELGYGESGPKSSTKVKQVDSLKGLHFAPQQQHILASGFASNFIVVDPNLANNRQLLDRLPVFVFDGEESKQKKPTKKAAEAKKPANKKKAKLEEDDDDE